MRTLKNHGYEITNLYFDFQELSFDQCLVEISLDSNNPEKLNSIKEMLKLAFNLLKDVNDEFGIFENFTPPYVDSSSNDGGNTNNILFPNFLFPMTCKEATHAIDQAWEATSDYNPHQAIITTAPSTLIDFLKNQLNLNPKEINDSLKLLPQNLLDILTQIIKNPNHQHEFQSEPPYQPPEFHPLPLLLLPPIIIFLTTQIINHILSKAGTNRSKK